MVGTPTFGKGTIQSVIPLDADTGVKVTVARYFTPAGHEVQAHGIVPDVAVAPSAGRDTALLPREANLANHLPPETDDGTAGPREAGPRTAGPRTAAEVVSTFGGGGDRPLRAAVALLAPERSRLPALVARLRGLVP